VPARLRRRRLGTGLLPLLGGDAGQVGGDRDQARPQAEEEGGGQDRAERRRQDQRGLAAIDDAVGRADAGQDEAEPADLGQRQRRQG